MKVRLLAFEHTTYEGANTQSNSLHNRECCVNMLTVYGLVGGVLMCVCGTKSDRF